MCARLDVVFVLFYHALFYFALFRVAGVCTCFVLLCFSSICLSSDVLAVDLNSVCFQNVHTLFERVPNRGRAAFMLIFSFEIKFTTR